MSRSTISRAEEEHWSIPAEPERISPLVLATASFLEQHGVGPTPLFKAQLLVEEIVSNVVRHGLRGDRTRRVHLRVCLDETGISLEVVDHAPPFDPLREAPAPDISSALQDRKLGGLGIHLVKQFADDIAYERRGDANCVRMQVRFGREATTVVAARRTTAD